MFGQLPKVIPINELKNTSQISKTCNESPVPIIITKNGYSDMIMMSVKLYEELVVKAQAAEEINRTLDKIEGGEQLKDGEEVFGNLRKKYGSDL